LSFIAKTPQVITTYSVELLLLRNPYLKEERFILVHDFGGFSP
jgi:hypothetical protein